MKTTTKYKIEKTSSLNFLLTIIICSSLFGLAMFKAGVFLVPVMREQFIFRCNIMLKMFLSAASFSTLSFTLMHMFGYNKNLNVVEKKYFETHEIYGIGLVSTHNLETPLVLKMYVTRRGNSSRYTSIF